MSRVASVLFAAIAVPSLVLAIVAADVLPFAWSATRGAEVATATVTLTPRPPATGNGGVR